RPGPYSTGQLPQKYCQQNEIRSDLKFRDRRDRGRFVGVADSRKPEENSFVISAASTSADGSTDSRPTRDATRPDLLVPLLHFRQLGNSKPLGRCFRINIITGGMCSMVSAGWLPPQ